MEESAATLDKQTSDKDVLQPENRREESRLNAANQGADGAAGTSRRRTAEQKDLY